ncbi:MAG TPA: endolytic transglycosylase MltG [Anaerolineales bacterium]|nr:endolytic transglycosylase MltG [Anaerolineales bacterium]
MTSQRARKSDRRSACLLVCALPILAAGCLGIVFGFNSVANLPRRAEIAFGPASPGLSGIQRYLIAARLLGAEGRLKTPMDPLAPSEPFTVEFGTPASTIVQQLVEAGLIEDGGIFSLYLQYGGKDKTIQSGEYAFSRSMSPIEIADALQDPTPAEVTFRVLAGWRMEEIAAALPTSGLEITPNQFLVAARREPQRFAEKILIPDGGSLEGLFAPGEYSIPRTETTDGLISTLVSSFENRLDAALLEAFSAQGLTPYEAVILASIVEREAVVTEEAPQIASVYLNRLAGGMKLDADPSVQYALGFNREQGTWWTNPLSLRDLEVKSPYNTYIEPQLPPGPISNPGVEALQAVASPAVTPYYYFRAACDGSGLHNFSVTFEEHLAKSCEGEN